MCDMTTTDDCFVSPPDLAFVKTRAKVLAREDRELKAALIRVRRRSGLSQQDVADRLGVTQQSIYKFERYDSDPKASTVRRYANAVGALVEHRVHTDIGQSVHLAARDRWVNASPNPAHSIEFNDADRVRVAKSGWKTSNRSDFDLAN
ncbi:DNA-binding transcriptional regulator, XRE-family HTH domain [Brevibacterium sp. 239c]|nr:DNA-binding transcriptional regulator, XRE-family HTH domain [Brevibacterium sp. 239c]